MIWLILGIVIWYAAHMFKRVAPGPRAAMTARMGAGSRGVFAAFLFLSVVLMVIGYRGMDFVPVWNPPFWGQHLNNLLMIGAVILFGVGGSKSRLRARMRHPMLLGFLTWAIAHLIAPANGDLASLILFGSLGVWAIIQIALINASGPWTDRWKGGSLKGDIRLFVIGLVVYAVFGLVHGLIGPSPFLM